MTLSSVHQNRVCEFLREIVLQRCVQWLLVIKQDFSSLADKNYITAMPRVTARALQLFHYYKKQAVQIVRVNSVSAQQAEQRYNLHDTTYFDRCYPPGRSSGCSS
jgi:hypothetical protein